MSENSDLKYFKQNKEFFNNQNRFWIWIYGKEYAPIFS